MPFLLQSTQSLDQIYNAIIEQNHLERAAKRVLKLVEFTEQNGVFPEMCCDIFNCSADQMKVSYEKDALALATQLTAAEALLKDNTIHNTLQGARTRLQRYNDYKVNAKRSILTLHFNLEALFNNLATRLKESEHPPFTPSKPELKIEGSFSRSFQPVVH